MKLSKACRRGFYETAGVVKVFVFAFVFSFSAFLLLFFVLCSLFFVRVLDSSRASIRTRLELGVPGNPMGRGRSSVPDGARWG